MLCACAEEICRSDSISENHQLTNLNKCGRFHASIRNSTILSLSRLANIGAHLGPIYVLYRLLAACLDISNVPTEFNVPACVKSQSNTQKSTAPTIESKINVHGQTHEHTVCKNAYTNNYLIRLEDRQLYVKAKTCLLTNDRQE